MLVCLECGRKFETARDVREEHGETVAVCPHCGNEEIDEAVRCVRCGEWTGTMQASCGLCADCEIDADQKLSEMLAQHFAPSERRYLLEQYGIE